MAGCIDMEEINREIKLTLSLMQTDICEEAIAAFECHLLDLLKMKRDEIQKSLVGCSWSEPITHIPSPYKSSIKLYGQIVDEDKPLTTEELKAGGWWCSDLSEAVRRAFELHSLNVREQWELEGLDGCRLSVKESVARFRGMSKTKGLREIALVDGEFYWS